MREIKKYKIYWGGKHIYRSYSYLSCDIFFGASAEKDQPKINSYAASKDIEQLSKDETSEEIIKSIGLRDEWVYTFFSSFSR
jgi:hypothetical protein